MPALLRALFAAVLLLPLALMAYENTLEAMTRSEGKEPPLVENAERVKAGVVTLIELAEKGWTIVRP